jgi:hypothetical protein
VAYTRQPERTSRSAVARPMPEEQPVISTALEGSGMSGAYALDPAMCVRRTGALTEQHRRLGWGVDARSHLPGPR